MRMRVVEDRGGQTDQVSGRKGRRLVLGPVLPEKGKDGKDKPREPQPFGVADNGTLELVVFDENLTGQLVVGATVEISVSAAGGGRRHGRGATPPGGRLSRPASFESPAAVTKPPEEPVNSPAYREEELRRATERGETGTQFSEDNARLTREGATHGGTPVGEADRNLAQRQRDLDTAARDERSRRQPVG